MTAKDGLAGARGAPVSLTAAMSAGAVACGAKAAQAQWASTPVRERLQLIRRLRHELALNSEALASTVPSELPGSLHRSVADTLVAELLPLLEACRFLEREADFLLAPHQAATTSRPRWLGGVTLETRREPLGVVLIIGPGNYPLLLPGVQALQALVAGNAVLWKPAPGGAEAAHALRRMLVANGLDAELLNVLNTSVEAASAAIHAGVDKVILTGSADTGRAVLRELAETLTPAVMELSGCDAVFVLEGSDLARAAEAIHFGLRLNGSATCMAPRRLFVSAKVADELTPMLAALLDSPVAGISVPGGSHLLVTEQTRARLQDLIAEATLYGATVVVNGLDTPASAQQGSVGPTLLTAVTADMRIAQSDIFAPVLSILRADDEATALSAYNACPYALTAAIFGPPAVAAKLAAQVNAGTVVINDIIVPTADPRASFSGRKRSGYGATRGREGLLAMTQTKTILSQRSRSRRAYQPTTAAHIPFFAGLVQSLHAGSLRERLAGIRKLISAAQTLK